MRTKVHRLVVLVIDHDDLGADGVREVLEHTKYPSWCINPDVKHIETREVEWSDEHPLNQGDTCDEAYAALFDDLNEAEERGE